LLNVNLDRVLLQGWHLAYRFFLRCLLLFPSFIVKECHAIRHKDGDVSLNLGPKWLRPSCWELFGVGPYCIKTCPEGPYSKHTHTYNSSLTNLACVVGPRMIFFLNSSNFIKFFVTNIFQILIYLAP